MNEQNMPVPKTQNHRGDSGLDPERTGPDTVVDRTKETEGKALVWLPGLHVNYDTDEVEEL
jgi:hypothetical protein